MGIIKPVIWVGVAGTLAAGTALAVMGPQRAHAFLNQARANINSSIDSNISDPVALRQQLRDLESKYPARIAEVRGELAETTSQVDQLQRERTVSGRVVELADADLGQIKSLLAKADAARTDGTYAVVKVRFGEESLSMDQAYSKANQISQLRSAYASRSSDIDRDMSLLQAQQQRLTQLLAQLESERSQFQNQLWQLDRQVDAIARNDRMIEMLQQRQEVFDRQDPYQAANLDHVQGRIAQTLAEQESKINTLANTSIADTYRTAAETELNLQTRVGQEYLDAQKGLDPHGVQFEPAVIEIRPDGETRSLPSAGRPTASKD
ncbi:MAG: hypothetical protein IPJ41_08575 [Phycisphaerales bacterium]|nr:hypothetical protein [Phycisphaerales bacterium]